MSKKQALPRTSPQRLPKEYRNLVLKNRRLGNYCPDLVEETLAIEELSKFNKTWGIEDWEAFMISQKEELSTCVEHEYVIDWCETTEGSDFWFGVHSYLIGDPQNKKLPPIPNQQD